MNNLTVVLPCYNPPEGWHKLILEKYISLTQTLNEKICLIIVNDGSTKLNRNGISFLESNIEDFQWLDLPENKGKGFALREGIRISTTPYCIYTDIDFPYQISSITDLYHQLFGSEDVVIGIKDESYYNQTPPIRKFISKSLRKLTRTFLKLKTSDTQCGLKGFNQKGKEVFLTTTINRYLFDLEFVYLCSKNNAIKIETKEVHLRDGVVFGKVNFGILKSEILNFIKIIFK